MQTTIRLPATAYEEAYPGLLAKLAAGDDPARVLIDFSEVRFYTPGALVLLLAKLQHWEGQGKEVLFDHCATCPAFRYLQRIDFFSQTGIDLPETFRRHDPGGRFVELRRIGGSNAATVEELSTDIAYCLFPDADVDDPEESGLFDLLQYSVSELANNVMQHAKAPGFATAQYTAHTDLIRVAIADSGIGILRSFIESASPHWREGMTDADAIALALRPKVSSKGHLTSAWGESVNAGVGLTLLQEFAQRTEGHIFMASGNGVHTRWAWHSENSPKQTPARFEGTICSLAFNRSKIRNFFELLQQSKQAVGLLPGSENFGRYFS